MRVTAATAAALLSAADASRTLAEACLSQNDTHFQLPPAAQTVLGWFRQKEYHLEALMAFQAYKQFYTDQIVPLLAEQKELEPAMLELEPKAALDAEVTCISQRQREELFTLHDRNPCKFQAFGHMLHDM